MTSQDEIGRLVGYMPIIIRADGVSDWARQFCASIIHRSRRGGWQPSEKQIAVMARIVDEFQASNHDDLVDRGQ